MQDDFPRLSVTRRVRDDGARYLGPFTDVKNLRRALRDLRRVFPLRTCRNFEELSDEENRENLVTSRILWLRGLEPGVNQGGESDSHDRYIYIHGTNHEDRIGSPQSAGCVLMRNLDLVELFEEVRLGDQVWIGL